MSLAHNQLSIPLMPERRVFLVEDVPAVRDLIVSSLADIEGMAWGGFSDSENDAIEQLKRTQNDILIVDIELRQGNGMSLLRRLMESDVHTECIKIIFSNNVYDAYRQAGAQYGVQYFFDKSFELPQLHALLKKLCSASGENG